MKLSLLGAVATSLLSATVHASPAAVHFDSGKLTVRKQDIPLIAEHCQYATEHPELSLQIQGHTDLRGSREFSLAIGQARAESVRKLLAACGLPDRRMEAMSFGKEQPLAAGTAAAAGRINRRVEIVYVPNPAPSQ